MSYGYGEYNAPRGAPPGGYDAHSGGFATPAGPPPGADPQLWNWFNTVDTDRSGHIAAQELQRALVNGDWTPFDIETVKVLMTLFDTDRSGTIGFNEFAGLWNYIKDWQNIFKHFDKDHSGSIDGNELSNALRQFGFNLSPQALILLERKYVKQAQPAGGPPAGPAAGITFDRFVRACVVVKQLSESFQKLDSDRDGWIQINYDQYMQTVLTSP